MTGISSVLIVLAWVYTLLQQIQNMPGVVAKKLHSELP